MDFDSPSEVSRYSDKETLLIELIEFRDMNGEMIADDRQLNTTIPNQLDESEFVAIKSVASVSAAAIQTQITINAIIQILKNHSFNQVLSSMKYLVLIVHIGLLTVSIPASAQLFFGQLVEIIAFDPVNIED